MPVHALGVVLDEAEVERRQRRHRSRDADRLADAELGQSGTQVCGTGVDVVPEPLRHTDAPDVEAAVELDAARPADDQLRRAAADIDHERAGSDLPSRGDTPKAEQRLLVPAEEPCGEAVAPLDLAQERLAVLGVSDGARRDGEDAFRAQRLGCQAVIDEAVADASDCGREQPPPSVDVLAQPGDSQAALDLADAAVVDVGHEQPRRVRTEVDRCDARHFEGMNDRTDATAERTSFAAPVSTRARASATERLSTCRWSAPTWRSTL